MTNTDNTNTTNSTGAPDGPIGGDIEEKAREAGLLHRYPRWPWRLDLRPGALHHDAGRAGRREQAADQTGAALRGWRDLPGAAAGLRVGIVADPCSHTPVVDEYVADLAWTLARGLYESVRDAPDTWPVHRSVVLAADPPPDPRAPEGDRYSQGLLDDHTTVFGSLTDGVAVAAHCAALHSSGGVRLLVLITGGQHIPTSPTGPTGPTGPGEPDGAGSGQGRVPPGCGVLTLCPVVYDDTVADRTRQAAATATGIAAGATEVVILDATDPMIPGVDLGTFLLDAMRGDRPLHQR